MRSVHREYAGAAGASGPLVLLEGTARAALGARLIAGSCRVFDNDAAVREFEDVMLQA